MSFLDKVKKQAGEAASKASDAVAANADKVDKGIDKAAGLASKATKGKYDDKIDTAATKAREEVDKIEKKNKGS